MIDYTELNDEQLQQITEESVAEQAKRGRLKSIVPDVEELTKEYMKLGGDKQTLINAINNL